MGPIAKKILQEFRKQRSRNVVDLEVIRASRDALATDDAEDIDASKLPPPLVPWMVAMKLMTDVAWPLLELKPLRKLAERIEESEERFMPGGPPRSPLTDSFHTSWLLADATIGIKRETLATLAIDVGRSWKASVSLLDAWGALAASYPGMYIVRRNEGVDTELEDVWTGACYQARHGSELWGPPGVLWWTRLLPPQFPGQPWVSLVSPYVFPEPDGAAQWRSYLARRLEGVAASQRSQAYRKLMKQGPDPRFGWFDYILDAYAGTSRNVVVLTGVPDRPESLPHPESSEALPSESSESSARSLNSLEKLRERALERAAETRAWFIAQEDFCVARNEILEEDAEELDFEDVSPHERSLLTAYAMYAVPDPDGVTAVEKIAQDSQTEKSVRQVAEHLLAGWFSVFEILDIRIDEGMEVRDVLRHRRFFIHERLASRQASLGDLLAGWVMVDEQERLTFEGALAHVPQVYAATTKEWLLNARDRIHTRAGWKVRNAMMVPGVSALVRHLLESRPLPVLLDRDGEPLLIAEASYILTDPAGVQARLDSDKMWAANGDTTYIHLGEDGESILGQVTLRPRQLVLRTHSRVLLKQLRDRLETRLGSAVVHSADSFVDPTSDAFRSESSDESVRSSESFPPEALESAVKTIEKHLDAWLEASIPALNNKTPRQAVRSKKSRTQVEALLMQQERTLRANEIGHAINFRRVWESLGLKYKGPFRPLV